MTSTLSLGRHWQEKMADMHISMKTKEADAMVVTGLDETACTLIVTIKPTTKSRCHKLITILSHIRRICMYISL